jgi:cbb3-type cytochrome oxidase subunit 3
VARNQSWTITVAVLVGLLLASIFWLYGPYLKGQVERTVAEALKAQQLTVELSPGSGGLPRGIPSQAGGPRYQMVADGKQVFLADLKEGRVWRYFHHTKEGGFAREDEGFLPVALYYGGKKFYSASDSEAPARAAEAAPARTPEKKPR